MLSAITAAMNGKPVTKGKLKPESGTAFEFQFNPSSLKYTRKVTWEQKELQAQTWPVLHYSKGVLDELSFSLLLDETESDNPLAKAMAGSVPNPFAVPVGAAMSGPAGTVAALALVKASSAARAILPKNKKTITTRLLILQALTIPSVADASRGDTDSKRPPFVEFEWGDFKFVGVVKAMDAEVILFDDKGNPKRATVQVTLEGMGLNSTIKMSDLADPTKVEKAGAKAETDAAKAAVQTKLP